MKKEFKTVVCLMGAPGSGKTTHSRRLMDELKKEARNVEFCAVGAKLRSKAQCLASGDLSKLADVLQILEESLNQKADFYILDGYPRSVEQAKALKEICVNKGLKLAIINIYNANEEALIKRLKSRHSCQDCNHLFVKENPESCPKCSSNNLFQRQDDLNDSVIQNRLRIYNELVDSIKKELLPEFPVYNLKSTSLDETYYAFKQHVASISN